MSFQSSTNKVLGAVAGVATAKKLADKQTADEIAKASKAEEAKAVEEQKLIKQQDVEKRQAEKARVEKASALLKAQKTEQSLIAQYTKGVAINNAAARKNFISSQFNYEDLRSGKISPLEFQASYLENLDNLSKKLSELDVATGIESKAITKKMNVKRKTRIKGGKR